MHALAFWIMYAVVGLCATAAYDYSQLKEKSGYTAMQLLGTLLNGCGAGAAWPLTGTIYFIGKARERFAKK